MGGPFYSYMRAAHVAMVRASKKNKGKTVKKVSVYHCTDCNDLWRKDEEVVPFVHDLFCIPGFKPHMLIYTIAIPKPPDPTD